MTEDAPSVPGPLGAEAYWYGALSEGRLLVQRISEDGQTVFPPRVVAPGTGGSLEWVEATGLGTVYSVTIVSPRAPELPYNVALVDLDEGVRMMSRVEGVEPAAVEIGMRVKARIAVENGTPIILFDPLEA